MSFGVGGGKRDREAARDRKKKEKEERLRHNRALRAKGLDPDTDIVATNAAQQMDEVKLEDINISGVAPRGPKGSNGPTKLFVGGLSWDTESEQLKAAFSPFGVLRESNVVTDRLTGRSRGFGFVVFEKPQDAAVAAREMNGAELDGRTIRVNAADRG